MALLTSEVAMNVPFLDRKVQYKQIEHEVVPVVTKAMAIRHVYRGPHRGRLGKKTYRILEKPGS